MDIDILSPAADQVDFKISPAPRLDSLDNKTIGLYNNMTGGADIAVNRVAFHLNKKFTNIKFVSYGGAQIEGRPSLSRQIHIDDEEAATIAKEVDAMVGATAH